MLAGPKVAVTDSGAVTVTLQVAAPVHAPDQPLKVLLAARSFVQRDLSTLRKTRGAGCRTIDSSRGAGDSSRPCTRHGYGQCVHRRCRGEARGDGVCGGQRDAAGCISVHAPLQPEKTLLVAGVSLSVTWYSAENSRST